MKPTDMPHEDDEDGEHDEESCYPCLAAGAVATVCRCGECCRRLIIEVLLQDAEVEPRIRERGSPIYTPAALTGTGRDELAGYLLNSQDNGGACVFFDGASNLCTIYETRPLLCRLFNCDGDDREELVELGILPPRGDRRADRNLPHEIKPR